MYTLFRVQCFKSDGLARSSEEASRPPQATLAQKDYDMRVAALRPRIFKSSSKDRQRALGL